MQPLRHMACDSPPTGEGTQVKSGEQAKPEELPFLQVAMQPAIVGAPPVMLELWQVWATGSHTKPAFGVGGAGGEGGEGGEGGGSGAVLLTYAV